jgi:ATP-dependent DNA helicase RecG
MVILNDGTLPEELSIEDLKVTHLSKPRNTLLADVFYKAGFIESWGRGTLKMLAECKEQGMPEPQFESINHLFSVAFLKADPKTDPKTDPKADPKTTAENQILAIISINSRVSIPEISAQIGKGITVTKEYIHKLKKNGLLKRIGPAKGGYWQVVESE